MYQPQVDVNGSEHEHLHPEQRRAAKCKCDITVTEKINYVVTSVHMAVCIYAIATNQIATMWWMWGVITLICGVITTIINLCNNVSGGKTDDLCKTNGGSLFISLWAAFMVFLFVYIPFSAENRDMVPVETIPALENQTLSWCYTACISTNNLTSTCESFNTMMFNVPATSPYCIDRTTKICVDNIGVTSYECSSLWNSLRYAVNNNDANTGPRYRIARNLLFGLLLSGATVLAAMLVTSIIDCIIRALVRSYTFDCTEPNPRQPEHSSNPIQLA